MLPGDTADPDGNQPETLNAPLPEAPLPPVDVPEPHIAAFAAWLDHELEQLELRWAPFAAPAALRDVKLRVSR
jgi:hypothetical protein